jgi:predicted ATPase
MIQSIEIKNFKSIKSKYFPLRNLNIMLGMNGQGKSSFIQSLLLLRQSERLSDGILKLNGGDNGLVNVGTSKDARYQYSKDNENLSFALQFKGSEPYLIEFDYEIDADVFKQKNISSNYIVQNKNEALFSSKLFQYLNAQRIEPKAINTGSYASVIEANDIGKYGQYTAHYIELRSNENVVFENILHKDSKIFDEFTKTETVNKTLINQINLWLSEISHGVNVKTTKVTSDLILLEYVFKQPNFGNTNRFKPENVGFGISYALHVVTALLKAKKGDLLIIENPESHIHPRGQAELGKLIALLAQNDVQIIIETHSDHIINGIRVGVKENPEIKDRTVLFYFEKVVTDNEQYSKITNIEIDSKGELSEYPKNLLEEWSNQLLKLL